MAFPKGWSPANYEYVLTYRDCLDPEVVAQAEAYVEAVRAADATPTTPVVSPDKGAVGGWAIDRCADVFEQRVRGITVFRRSAYVQFGMTRSGRDAWFVNGWYETNKLPNAAPAFDCTVSDEGEVLYLVGTYHVVIR